MEEEQHTRDLIAQMQAQIQAQARTIQAQTHAQQEMQRRHAEEITMLRAERGRAERSTQHSESTADRGHNQHNDNAGSRNQQPSRHTDPNDRGRREPSPLRTDRPSSLLPFTAIVMQAPMPEKNPPVLDKYDGSTDPDNHLRIFTNAMVFYTDSDPVMCRAFSLSLKDEALEWYNTLPPNTVDCFATVENLFKRQYASNRNQEVTPAELVNTKQEKGETLKAFMKRYMETARRVKEVSQSFIITTLPSCLKPGYFAEKLYARPPKTMEELQERIAEFIRMEDLRISQRKQQQETEASGGRKDGKRPFDNNGKSGEFSRTFKFNHYTPLNTPRAKVLEEALNAELLTLQTKPSPRYADERKSCHFHQNRGHTTEECITLKNEIERLVRAGHLRKYIQEARRSPERAYRKNERRRDYSRSPARHRERSARGVIN
ncbi:uncharacterized protein LOC128195325 [Vigna angularis]|uniref:uncharacterized protein LOC128195325 n=1 Tax=Phaseolus angularis TaxID=3914 RepID=UPI000809DD9B|nr:uncharacterized protein LOC128195325 [Vigna angularis]